MEKLRLYLNSLLTDEQREFATKCGSSIGYFRKAINTKEFLNPITCVNIEYFSSGAVTRKELRPNDWESIWPELKNTLIDDKPDQRCQSDRRADRRADRRNKAIN